MEKRGRRWQNNTGDSSVSRSADLPVLFPLFNYIHTYVRTYERKCVWLHGVYVIFVSVCIHVHVLWFKLQVTYEENEGKEFFLFFSSEIWPFLIYIRITKHKEELYLITIFVSQCLLPSFLTFYSFCLKEKKQEMVHTKKKKTELKEKQN